MLEANSVNMRVRKHTMDRYRGRYTRVCVVPHVSGNGAFSGDGRKIRKGVEADVPEDCGVHSRRSNPSPHDRTGIRLHDMRRDRLRRERQEVSWTDLTLWRKRVTLSFKGEVAFAKMPPPSVPNLLMSDWRFNCSLRHGRFYCTLLLAVFSDEKIRFSNFAASS